MSDADYILDAVDIRKSYQVSETETTEVLRGVGLRLKRTASVSIIGPSGCGKSTLLNILGTLDKPDSGKVLLEGRDISALNDKDLAALRNERIGFVFQLHHLLPQCTILENVLVPSLVRKSKPEEAPEERARRLLDRVGLSHRLTHRPGRLSGGERQRVAVVRALINKPRILLADEPTGSLDRKGARALCGLLSELNREEDVAIVMVTHSLELARTVGNVYELKEGIISEYLERDR